MKGQIVLSPEVLHVLDASTITGSQLVLNGQLDRKLYVEVNKALEALGGKWDKRAKAHLFDDDPSFAIDRAINTGSVVNDRKALNFYETPVPVADSMLLDYAEIAPGMSILEPSAGEGALVKRIFHHQLAANVDVCEIDDARRFSLSEIPGVHVVYNDFLLYSPGPVYDRVIANPPFSERRDLHHVMHMLDCLRPGGMLVSVMGAGAQFRDDRLAREFRALMPDGEFFKLPDNSFKISGTGVNAVLFVAGKP